MDLTYVLDLEKKLRKEQKRTEVYSQVTLILSIACVTLVLLLAFYSSTM